MQQCVIICNNIALYSKHILLQVPSWIRRAFCKCSHLGNILLYYTCAKLTCRSERGVREIASDNRKHNAGGHVQPLVEDVHSKRHGHDNPSPSAFRVVVLLEGGHFGFDHHRAQDFTATGQVAARRQPRVQVCFHVCHFVATV